MLHSIRCDCGAQLDAAMERIAAEGRGVLLYLNQEGRGIGLANKIRAYELQDEGFDTVEANERLGFKADQRDYGMGVQILRELGVRSMRLLSNNPRKLVGIEGYGLSVSEWLPLEIPASDSTRRYLKTKKEKLGHKLSTSSGRDRYDAVRIIESGVCMTVKGQLHGMPGLRSMAGMRAASRGVAPNPKAEALLRACLDLVEHLVRQSLDVTTAEVETTLGVLEQRLRRDGSRSRRHARRHGGAQERHRPPAGAPYRAHRQVTAAPRFDTPQPVRYDKRLR